MSALAKNQACIASCDENANGTRRHQPWSTYAVYLTTVFHWAIVWDALLIYLYFDMARCWQDGARDVGLAVLAGWMFSSKFVKLLGHYIRYPGDSLLLPVSILFGYFHGFIKGYAMLSLNVVSLSFCSATLSDDLLRKWQGTGGDIFLYLLRKKHGN